MDTTKYENNMPFPQKPPKPRLAPKHTAQDAEVYAEKLYVYEKLHAEYLKTLKEYHRETGRLEAQFKHDALEDVGLLSHPKGNKAYAMARDRGHSIALGRGNSSGLPSVYYELCDIADLLLDD